MTEQQLTPIEAINEYYRLKEKYESVYYDKYIKPILKSDKSKREKRVEYSRLPKHECINCKRNVGTIFSIVVDNNELLRKFIAKCGDVANPCPLDIQINYSLREPFETSIASGLDDVEKIKLDIIKQKNNVLFFNKDANVVSEFERLTKKLKMETEHLGSTIEMDILKNNNPAKAALLSKTIDEFGQSFILPFKQMVQDYLDKNDELILNQALRFYVDEMLPKLKEIQELRYEVNFVEYDENTNEYTLIQRANSLQNKEFTFEDDDKVVKFVRGEMKKSKKDRLAQEVEQQEELVIRTNNKLKKLNTKLELIEATEALEEMNTLETGPRKSTEEIYNNLRANNKQRVYVPFEPAIIENGEVRWPIPWHKNTSIYQETWNKLPENVKSVLKSHPDLLNQYMKKLIDAKANGEPFKMNVVPEEEPIIANDGQQVNWNSEAYRSAWAELPVKLQDALKTDKPWLKEFMFNCVNARANDERCKMVAPPNLLVPPNLIELEDGKYDLGVPIYTEVFNKLGESNKETYFKFYTPKFETTEDGKKVEVVKDRKYDDKMFKIMINKDVARELGFAN